MKPEEFLALRLRLGKSQEEMARLLGFSSRASVCRFERGQRKIAGPLLKLLEKVVAENPASPVDNGKHDD